MLLYYILILWPIQVLSYSQFNVYNLEYYQDRHCLLYYVLDHHLQNGLTYKPVHQSILYCLRSANESIFDADLNFNNTIDPRFTFDDLRKNNITSQQLLSWSAPIDLAERYEMFLIGTSSKKESVFYNCTSNSFGDLCRFVFSPVDKTFDQIVDYYFQMQFNIGESGGVTCYKHLDCQTSSFCLDWREICDRKSDCLDGSDEFNCWQLEINECNQDEYHCQNGQCISEEFYYDAPINPDCIDQSDEQAIYIPIVSCSMDPSFRCEETVCRSGWSEIPCGAGICVSETMFSCPNGRNNLALDDFCSKAMACKYSLFSNEINSEWCRTYCPSISACIKNNCSSVYEFPTNPIVFKHVRLLFESNATDRNRGLPDYVCYNEQLCGDFLPTTISKNNFTCRHFHEIGYEKSYQFREFSSLISDIKMIFRACVTIFNETHHCNNSRMYQCENSTKCISKHRLVDGVADCPYFDDELYNESCSLSNAHYRLKCFIYNGEKCLAPTAIRDEIIHCDNSEDEPSGKRSPEDDIRFPIICDGYQDLEPMLINEQHETDETNCEHWLCNNTYTRCDHFWSCTNGADEINCPRSTCSQFEHACVFPNDTSKLSCLPMDKAGDNITHCIGASDERVRYLDGYNNIFFYKFRCWNDTKLLDSRYICNKKNECLSGDDEMFCKSNSTFTCSEETSSLTEMENFFCALSRRRDRSDIIYFTLRNIQTYPTQIRIDFPPSLPSSDQMKSRLIQSNSVSNIKVAEENQCNRGIPVNIRMNGNQSNSHCLCPPSYYGDQCQYQNQRISLTVQIRTASNWRQVFTFIITLIDNEGHIESYDYIEYLPIRDCDIKFNMYLLYLTRPKNVSKNYSVRIDAFNKLKLEYRASWIFPIRFPFLPVYRLSVSLKTPHSNIQPSLKCTLPCIHGQCFNYINEPNITFCRCSPEWSGIQCDIPYTCNCGPGSLCVYDSICICPIDRFGPRCYLQQSSCHSKSCENGGRCVSMDERYIFGNVNKSICICSEEYSGARCEHRQSRIEILFHHDLTIPSSLTAHFIAAQFEAKHIQTDLVKKIPFDRTSIYIYTSIRFNIAFLKIIDDYYLIIVREQIIISANVTTKILPSHRCLSIKELFNESFAREPLLKRIKYFQIPCDKKLELICFYDDIYFCLCDLDRRANCFEFEQNVSYNCRGQNFCENQGRCLLNDPQCPTSSICACDPCYYGSTCRFSTEGSTLLLDTILGHRIYPNIGITQQPVVVKVSIVITTIIFCLGFLSSLLSYLTFRRKEIRSVGCGIYLFVSSIVSLTIMIVFTIKFWLLVLSQIGSIESYSFISVQCKFIDFFLRSLLSINDWLHGYVAIERAINVSKGIKFNTRKSKQIAKWLIIFVFFLTICTYTHDPIHRHLVHDEEDQRTWCVTEYSLSLKKFDWIVNAIHFFVPFSINCISALIIIINSTRIRSIVQEKVPYKQILRQQFQHHKHLLISPIILVMLAVPRLIISFLSGCMKSTQDSWLYLVAYFISFIPPTLHFFIFVLPSETYKKEFIKSIQHFYRC